MARFPMRNRLLIAPALLLCLLVGGTAGYRFIWGLGTVDALYMTVITVSTVGFSEIGGELSDSAHLFTILLIFSSIGLVGFSVTSIASFVLEGELNNILRGRKMDKRIAGLTDHFILCGAGPTGLSVAHEFAEIGRPFVVIEHNREVVEHSLEPAGIAYVMGDATEDDTLRLAGVEKARGLLALMDDDRDNVFAVLSARSLNPNLRIIARAKEPENEHKMQKAGADQVVMTDAIGGMRMASVMLRPSVVTFLDKMLRMDGALRMEEATIAAGSDLVGKSLVEAQINQKAETLVVAIQRADGGYEFNPRAASVLKAKDVLIVMGNQEQCAKLGAMTRGRGGM